MTDSSRMFVVNRVTLLGLNFPIPVEVEEFGLSKKADTKSFQIGWWRQAVGKHCDDVVPAGGSVSFHALQYVLPCGTLNQVQTAM